jgi:hypothetical protein
MPTLDSKYLIDQLYGEPKTKGEKKLEDFKKKNIPKPEAKYSGHSELFQKLDIDAQYNQRYESLKSAGILEDLSNKDKGIIGIDRKEYPIPTLDQVKAMIAEKEAVLAPKIEQGFTKIILVPFAMPLDTQIDRYKETILKHHRQGTLLATNGDKLDLDKNNPVWVWDKYKSADINGNLVYYPEQLNQANHNGKTKQEIINSELSINGWQIKLIEDLPDLPASAPPGGTTAGKPAETINGRKQLEAGQSPKEYLNKMKTDPEYRDEQGLTPEDYIAYAITHLEEKNQAIDDWKGQGKACYMTGAYFPSSDYVPYGCWGRGGLRADLGGYGPGGRSSDVGVRAEVSV